MSEAHYRYDVRYPRNGAKRCPVCWRIKRHPEEFRGARGGVIYVCTKCAAKKAEYHAKWRARERGFRCCMLRFGPEAYALAERVARHHGLSIIGAIHKLLEREGEALSSSVTKKKRKGNRHAEQTEEVLGQVHAEVEDVREGPQALRRARR